MLKLAVAAVLIAAITTVAWAQNCPRGWVYKCHTVGNTTTCQCSQW